MDATAFMLFLTVFKTPRTELVKDEDGHLGYSASGARLVGMPLSVVTGFEKNTLRLIIVLL